MEMTNMMDKYLNNYVHHLFQFFLYYFPLYVVRLKKNVYFSRDIFKTKTRRFGSSFYFLKPMPAKSKPDKQTETEGVSRTTYLLNGSLQDVRL